MTEKPYQNREIDDKFRGVHERFDKQDDALASIDEKVTYTNGKVKKIIIALAILVGVAIGVSGKDILPVLIKLLI
jgi:tetrahydromethanopterin S-methyltransferase subunit G